MGGERQRQGRDIERPRLRDRETELAPSCSVLHTAVILREAQDVVEQTDVPSMPHQTASV